MAVNNPSSTITGPSSSLNAICPIISGTNLISAPDLAVVGRETSMGTFNARIVDDKFIQTSSFNPQGPGLSVAAALTVSDNVPAIQFNRIYIPRRGWLTIQPGDYIVVDAQGFPYLVPEVSLASGVDATRWRIQ